MIIKRLNLETDKVTEESILFVNFRGEKIKLEDKNILPKLNEATGNFEVEINGSKKPLSEVKEEILIYFPQGAVEQKIFESYFEIMGKYPNDKIVNKLLNYILRSSHKMGPGIVNNFNTIVTNWIMMNNKTIKE